MTPYFHMSELNLCSRDILSAPSRQIPRKDLLPARPLRTALANAVQKMPRLGVIPMTAVFSFNLWFLRDWSVALTSVHFRSDRHTWETPPEIFRRLDREFHFDLDVCALPNNSKCKRFFSPADDGLTKPWRGVCWMNPPYGSQIGKWMKKAFEEHRRGATVVCLVPARTDTAWWHDYAMRGEIRFVRKRIQFVGADSSAPFPSAIVIFRDRWWEQR